MKQVIACGNNMKQIIATVLFDILSYTIGLTYNFLRLEITYTLAEGIMISVWGTQCSEGDCKAVKETFRI